MAYLGIYSGASQETTFGTFNMPDPSAITVMCWLHILTSTDSVAFGKSAGTDDTNNEWSIGAAKRNAYQCWLQTGGNTATVLATSADIFTVAASQDNPDHLAMVYDGVTMRLYVNGTEVASTAKTGSLAQTSYSVIAGKTGTGGKSKNYHGGVGDPRVYNRALSAKEIELIVTTRGRDKIDAGKIFHAFGFPSVGTNSDTPQFTVLTDVGIDGQETGTGTPPTRYPTDIFPLTEEPKIWQM